MVAGPLVDQVLQRVRDQHGVIASRAFVLKMLSVSQILVNAKLHMVLDTATLTTEPLRCFYPIRSLLPRSQKVLYVQEGPRDLVYADWKTFWYMKRGWPREVGEQYQIWSRIGRDMVVVWPTRRVSVDLAVTSSKMPERLQNEYAAIELQAIAVPAIVDMAEMLTLLRMRMLAPAQTTMEALAGRMKELGGDS